MDGESKSFDLDEVSIVRTQRRMNRLIDLIRRSFSIVHQAAPKQLYLTSVLQIIAAGAVTAQVLITRELLVRLFDDTGSEAFSQAIPWVVALTFITAMVTLMNLVRNERQRLMGEYVGRSTMDEVLGSAASADLISFETPSFHNRLMRARSNATMRPLQMVNGLVGIFGSVLSAAGIALALFIVAPLFMVALLVGYVPLVLATRKATRLNYGFAKRQAERDRRRGYLSFMLTDRRPAAEIHAYELGPPLRERWRQLTDERIADLKKISRRRLRWALIGNAATATLNAGALILLVWFVATERIALADAGAAAAAMILLAQRLRGLAGGANSLYESSLFIEDFTEFVDEQRTEHHERSARMTATAGPLERLEVRNLTFSYPSRDYPVINELSFTIERGQVVAIVGENGSGKSTLTKILAGLYLPPPATVYWNGTDVTTIDQSSIHDNVSVIFQDFARFFMTASENIAAGRWERREDVEAIQAAADAAGIASELERLKDGLQTQLGAQYYGGSDISGGQWQRLAIARGFFRDATLLILDEPSASLDARSERQLFDRLAATTHERTVVVVSHRFSSVVSADVILVLNDGTLVEAGSHHELLDAGGLYAEMYRIQAGEERVTRGDLPS